MLPIALVLLSSILCVLPVRLLGIGLHKRFPVWRNIASVALALGVWVVLLVYGVLWQKDHERAVIDAWCADNGFALQSFTTSDVNGQSAYRRRFWQWEYRYRLDPAGPGQTKVVQIGNWFTGNLSDTVTVIR